MKAIAVENGKLSTHSTLRDAKEAIKKEGVVYLCVKQQEIVKKPAKKKAKQK